MIQHSCGLIMHEVGKSGAAMPDRIVMTSPARLAVAISANVIGRLLPSGLVCKD